MTIKGRIGEHGFLDSYFDYGIGRKSKDFNRVSLNDSKEFVFMSQGGNAHEEFGFIVLDPFAQQVYRFHAERPNVGRCPIGRSNRLSPDAANLAEVLNHLQTVVPFRFEELNRLAQRIFPQIARLSVEMVQSDPHHSLVYEIKVWLDEKREDLAIPLNQCGTGIGQALSILSILVNSDEGRTIIIDEPQSFLHPGAARTLVQIMNEHQGHQYILSTHSPEILAVSKPASVTVLDYSDGQSKVKTLNLNQSSELRRVLAALGVDLSIFFATKVLWVEGSTEEKAFPLIVKKFLGDDFESSLTVHALADTGGIQAKKHAKRMLEIYRTLSGAHALVPPIAAVILDDENRDDGVIRELKRLGEGRLHFIPRKCYENYLLDLDAVAAIANKQEDFSETPIAAEQVARVFKSEEAVLRFLPQSASPALEATEHEWVRTVDGARLLEYVFSELSEHRVTYQKTTHSVEITKWLLKRERGNLKEIAELIENLTS